MADHRTKTRPQSALSVDVHEEYEVRDWPKKFGCTPEQLKAAVAKVGVLAADLERELKTR